MLSFSEKLAQWLDVKPRLTVIAAGLIAAIDGFVVFNTTRPHAVVWMGLLLVITVLVFGAARRLHAGFVLCSLCVLMYMLASVRLWRYENPLGDIQPGTQVCVRGTVQRLTRSASGGMHLYVKPYAWCTETELHSDASMIAGRQSWLPVQDKSALLLVQACEGAEISSLNRILCGKGQPKVELSGRLRSLPTNRFPWDFDLSNFYRRQGVRQELAMAHGEQPIVLDVGEPAREDVLAAIIDDIRSRMVLLHQNVLGAADGALLSSMVIGDKAVRPDAHVRDQFRALGLSHLVAASGFNLTVVTAVAWWAVRFVFRSSWLIGLWCLSWITFFCLLAGFSPSVERAALMCLFVIFCGCFRRSVYLPASIGAALIITLILDPLSVADAGLQLSYGATLCIALSASKIQKILSSIFKLPGPLAETVAVVLSANAAVLPLQMIYFWQVGELSIIANALVSPLVAPITVLGFIASILAGIGGPLLQTLASGLDVLNGWPLRLMMLEVKWLSACDWSVLHTGPPLVCSVVLYYVTLAIWMACLPSGANLHFNARILIVAIVSSFLVACTVLLFCRPAPSVATVVFFRSSILTVLPNGVGLLVGSNHDPAVSKGMILLRVRRLAVVPIPGSVLHTLLPSRRAASCVVQADEYGWRRVKDFDRLFCPQAGHGH